MRGATEEAPGCGPDHGQLWLELASHPGRGLPASWGNGAQGPAAHKDPAQTLAVPALQTLGRLGPHQAPLGKDPPAVLPREALASPGPHSLYSLYICGFRSFSPSPPFPFPLAVLGFHPSTNVPTAASASAF